MVAWRSNGTGAQDPSEGCLGSAKEALQPERELFPRLSHCRVGSRSQKQPPVAANFKRTISVLKKKKEGRKEGKVCWERSLALPEYGLKRLSESESRSVVSDSLRSHGTLQDRILDWGAVPFSRGSSQLRDRTHVSCTAGRFFTSWATREAPNFPKGSCFPVKVYEPQSGREWGLTSHRDRQLQEAMWQKRQSMNRKFKPHISQLGRKLWDSSAYKTKSDEPSRWGGGAVSLQLFHKVPLSRDRACPKALTLST